MTEFVIKRAYDSPAPDDGVRLLVDRLWPRGIRKEDLQATWLKDLAPSPELRKWWNHNPDTMEQFASAYRAELEDRGQDLLDEVRDLIKGATRVTLVYAARDARINHARILRDWLDAHEA